VTFPNPLSFLKYDARRLRKVHGLFDYVEAVEDQVTDKVAEETGINRR